MTCAEIEELIELYVIGALPTEEAREVSAHLDSCAGCREAAERTLEVAQMLRLGVDQLDPSPALRGRLLAVVREGAAPATAGVVAMGRSAPWRVVLGWFSPAHPFRVAAAFAVVPLLLSGWLGFQVVQLRSEMQSAETALASSWETSQNAAEIMGKAIERGGAMASLQGTGMAPAVSGMLYYAPSDNEAVLVVRGLPEIERGHVYQCWLMSGEKRMNAGTFYRETDGRAMLVIKSAMPLDSVDLVGVTEEPHGGSMEPRGQRYMWSRLRRV